jgi:UV DNA damage endonuclease
VTGAIRLGYACINLTLGEAGKSSRTSRLANATPERLEALSRANLAGLLTTLRWNVAHHIRLFRITSDLIPLASHRAVQWPWRGALAEEFAHVGECARGEGLRLSMHPGQYTVLNSPNSEIVEQSMAELDYHAAVLDALGLPRSCKIVLHVGGVYGDRAAALQRFQDNFRRLSPAVQQRLVIENDERLYGVEDVLELSHRLGIPVVFDVLHHEVATGERPSRSVLEQVFQTWKPEDGRPKLHIATQKPDARPGAHAEYVDNSASAAYLELLSGCTVDLMLEAKAKDLALLRLRESFSAQPPVEALPRTGYTDVARPLDGADRGGP